MYQWLDENSGGGGHFVLGTALLPIPVVTYSVPDTGCLHLLPGSPIASLAFGFSTTVASTSYTVLFSYYQQLFSRERNSLVFATFQLPAALGILLTFSSDRSLFLSNFCSSFCPFLFLQDLSFALYNFLSYSFSELVYKCHCFNYYNLKFSTQPIRN